MKEKYYWKGFIIGVPGARATLASKALPGFEFIAEPLIITRDDLEDVRESSDELDVECAHYIIEECISELEQKGYQVAVLNEEEKEKLKKALASEK